MLEDMNITLNSHLDYEAGLAHAHYFIFKSVFNCASSEICP